MIEDSKKSEELPAEDPGYSSALRPENLEAFSGQAQLKKNIGVMIAAAKDRSELVEHVLLYGPPGVGKTTLASIIATEMEAKLVTTAGPALERMGDVAAILSAVPKGGVLFIDEIHRLKRTVEEMLYTAMEDGVIDVVVGAGAAAKVMRLPVPASTIIGATTQLSRISAPLRGRFGAQFRVDTYDDGDIAHIVKRSAGLLEVELEKGAAEAVAGMSRGTPRVANTLLRRVRDFAAVHKKSITPQLVLEALKELGMDASGLSVLDRKVLHAITTLFGGGPVGIATLAAAVEEEADTVEEVVEPFLMRCGLIQKTARGRIATKKGMAYMSAEK